MLFYRVNIKIVAEKSKSINIILLKIIHVLLFPAQNTLQIWKLLEQAKTVNITPNRNEMKNFACSIIGPINFKKYLRERFDWLEASCNARPAQP